MCMYLAAPRGGAPPCRPGRGHALSTASRMTIGSKIVDAYSTALASASAAAAATIQPVASSRVRCAVAHHVASATRNNDIAS